MDRSNVLEILREHETALKAAGVAHLRLFGSTARDTASLHSDVDLLVEFDHSKRLTLVTIGHLQEHLSELLGVSVDLATSDSLRESVSVRAHDEAVLAF